MDIEDKIPVPNSIRDYLRGMGKSLGVLKWIWKETTTPRIRKYGYQLLLTTSLLSIMGILTPGVIQFFFDAYQYLDETILESAAKVGVVFAIVICYLGCKYGRALEGFVGEHPGRIDERITELFREKSLGQHSSESSYLSAGNVEKVRAKILAVLSILVFEASPVVLSLIASYVLLWLVSARATLIMTGVILFYLGMSLYLNKKVLETCGPIDIEARKRNRYLFAVWDNIAWVLLNNRADHEIDHTKKWYADIVKKDKAFWVWYGDRATGRHMVARLCFLGIMAYGVHKAIRGEATTMSTLYMTASWCGYIVDNLWQIGHAERTINYHIPSIMAMIETLSIKPAITVREHPVRCEGVPLSVRFENVSFEYDDSEIKARENVSANGGAKNGVLRNVSFEILPGEKVALIGRSGAGKSTIMNLLLRANDPKKGKILVNNTDLRDLDLWWWYRTIGYIPQRPVIFDGTIRDNLLYGLDSEAAERVTAPSLSEFAGKMRVNFEGRLTHGFETMVGRNGIKLSGGESQRMIIAAAVIKKPRFMIIDEPTSSLDSLTEDEVQVGLEEALGEGVGALIIAHRLSTIRKCNKFVVLRQAALLRNGDSQVEAVSSSFEELYDVSETFRKMAEKQHLKM